MEHEKIYKGNPFRKEVVEYPMCHLKLKTFDDVFVPAKESQLNYIYKIQASVVDVTDDVIYSAIIEEAKKTGVTDLYLLDREFVLSALTNEMERRFRVMFISRGEKYGNLK